MAKKEKDFKRKLSKVMKATWATELK